MTWLTDDIYRSSNGDVWQLLREAPAGTILVRHVPNQSSGGRVTEITVEAFLAVNGPGPEHAALREFLKRLAAPAYSNGFPKTLSRAPGFSGSDEERC